MSSLAAVMLGIPWKKIGLWLVKAKFWLLAVLKPFGVFGILGLSMIDSAAIPMPFLDPLIVSYGAADHGKTVLYCFMAALGSAIGGLLPYYLGRAGGELFLLKRINRERYEKLRDRFEKQEFLAIMLPAMCPPPMPVKLFELAAGVFEMRVVSYFLAITAGKFIRFLVESILVIVYGPAVLTVALRAIHQHLHWVLSAVFVMVFAGVIWLFRRVFDRRGGIPLEVEKEEQVEIGPGDSA